jgi:DNA-binding LacI/PurR family transcriptional regulator
MTSSGPQRPRLFDENADNSVVSTVVGRLRDNIQSELWRPGEQLPSIRRLCAELAVSTNTLAAALGILEKEGLIVRQKRRGVFVRQSTRQVRQLPVAVLCHTSEEMLENKDGWMQHVVLGIMSRMGEHHLNGSLIKIPRIHESWPKLKEQLEKIKDGFGGMIFTWAPCGEKQLHETVREWQLPIVKIGRFSYKCQHNYVSIDHFAAGRLAASQAMDRLPGRFLILSGVSPHDFPRRQLICGFLDKLQEHLDGKVELEVLAIDGVSKEHGRDAMLDYLRQHPSPPNCVYTVGDMIAIGAMEACLDHGLHVPEDIIFIGSAGLTASQVCRPTLAHVQQPLEELGRRSVDLLDLMYRKDLFWLLGQELPVTWVEGGSCLPQVRQPLKL